MKFKLEIDMDGPEFEGDTFSRVQAVLGGITTWLGTVEWRFDDVRVPPVRLPLPLDEFGLSEKPIVNADGDEVGRVGFHIVEPATAANQANRDGPFNTAGAIPPFKAPAAKR